jgi:prolyl-tRNA editing enzyme YbaK/EbsC (Cys-tRNA(Pro) deacylase)
MDAIETKVTRLLDANAVPYTLLPHSQPVFTVEEAAAQRGVKAEEMVKAILLRESGRDRYLMACLLGPDRLDHRAVRNHLPGGWKRLTFANAEEIQAITGYVQGAVTPLCLPDDVPVLFDEAIGRCRQVNISTGDTLFGLEMDAHHLVHLAKARLVAIAEKKEWEPGD